MSNEELTLLILDKLEWDYDKELNPNRYSKSKPLYAGELILALLNKGTLKEASISIDISYKTTNTAIARFFIPIFGKLNGGGESWKFKLINFIEHTTCSDCHKTMPYIMFDKDRSVSSGHNKYCKVCRKVYNAQSYKKESTQEAHKRSREKHYGDIRARSVIYRIERAQRVPLWSETEEIREFYKNCPEGHHVDHIIPLKGKIVSGLHVISNLQYLTAEENMKKGNRFIG